MTYMNTATPLYRDLDDDALVAAYWDVRRSNANASAMNRRPRLLRDLDIIVGIARKRGLRLV